MTTSTLSLPKESSRAPRSDRLDGMFERMRESLRLASRREAYTKNPQAGVLRRLLEAEPELRFSEAAKDPDVGGRRLCAHLLGEARALLGSDSKESEHVAELALFLAQRLDPTAVPAVVIFDLQAQAWLFMGEARTTAGALAPASMALQLAGCLLSCGSGDVHLQAGFLRAKARLYRARGEDELARQATHRATVILAPLTPAKACS